MVLTDFQSEILLAALQREENFQNNLMEEYYKINPSGCFHCGVGKNDERMTSLVNRYKEIKNLSKMISTQWVI